MNWGSWHVGLGHGFLSCSTWEIATGVAEVVSAATGEVWFPSNKFAHFVHGIFRYGVHKLTTVATNLVRYGHLDWKQLRNGSCFDSKSEQVPGINEYAPPSNEAKSGWWYTESREGEWGRRWWLGQGSDGD